MCAVGLATVAYGIPFGPITFVEAASNYPTVVLQDSPAAYWRLGETSGTSAADASGHNNPLTYQVSVTLGQPGAVVGDPNRAAQFNGTTSYASRTTAPVAGTTNWSLEAWIYPTALPQLGVAIYNGIDDSTHGGYGFEIASSTGASGSNIVGILGSAGVADSGYTLPAANRWYHVVMTRDTSTIRFYVNGQQTPTTSTKTPATPGAKASVGGGLTAASSLVAPFAGVLDEPAMYATALGQGRIVAHYQEGGNVQTGFGKWIQQNPATVPAARSDASITYDASRNKVVMFGGKNASGTALSETWTYDGTNWTKLTVSPSPSARSGGALAYNAATSTVILFGGYTGTSYLNDTWSWNGTAWSQLTPGTSPGIRAFTSVAYDTPRSTIVLFGGQTSSNPTVLNETWTWNGTTWSKKTPATSPPARYLASAAYDLATTNVVLFGGYSGSANLGDTWSWNGTTWTQSTGAPAPSIRRADALVFDGATNQLTLFGGYSGTSYLNDTWAWDGSTWSAELSATLPPVRADAAAAYQSPIGSALLYGGTTTSALSDTWAWTTPPSAPLNVQATAGNAQATVTWSVPASNGGAAISSYSVTPYVGSTPGSATAATGTSATITGLANGTSYTFQVISMNSVGSGPGANSAAVTPATVPGAPTSVQATPGSTQATVSWTAPASNGGTSITGYTVTSNPGSFMASTTGATAATVTGLTNGSSYTFTVTATNRVGTGPASTPSGPVTPATVPGAPTNISATAGNAQATVTWTAPTSNGGSAITGYTVTPYIGSTAQGPTVVGATPTTATVTGLTNGTLYTFTVAASNALGTGPASAASAGVTPAGLPGAPTNVSATLGDRSATVSWTAPATNGSAITSYTITPYVNGVAQGSLVTSATASPGSVSGLTNGTAYTFTVSATNGVGTGPASAPSAAIVPAGLPGAPTNVSATAANGSATVTWAAPGNNGSTITSYTVIPYINGVAQGSLATTATSSPATVPGLSNGTAYTFTVSATNGVGTGPASTPSTPVTPASLPAAPTNVTATAGNGTASVSWAAPANNGSTITSYTITPYINGVAQTSLITTSAASPATVSGLANGTPYTFTVAATNGVGTGPASLPSSAATPLGPPTAPTNASASVGPSDGQATITWGQPVSNGGSGITSYTVTPYVGSTAGTPSIVNPSFTSVVIGGLTDGATYTFQVKATNNIGTGPAGVSPPITLLFAPSAPQNVLGAFGNQQATVSWDAPATSGGTSITAYTITPYVGSIAQSGAVTVGASQATAVVQSLTNGTTYTFVVTATNSVGTGPGGTSNPVTPCTTPGPPTNVAATAGDGQATVNWGAPLDDGGSGIGGYVITPYVGSSPASGPATVYGNTTSYLWIGLANGTTYTFQVAAQNNAGTGPAASSNAVVPAGLPGQPGRVQLEPGDARATVSWVPANPNGSPITAYTITPYQGGNAGSSLSVSGSVSVAQITGLTDGLSYSVIVTATNSVGTGAGATSNAVIPGPAPTCGSTNAPCPRFGANTAFDSATGTLVLFGGSADPSGVAWLDDTWTWNGSLWTVHHPVSYPPPGERPAMAYDAAMQKVVLLVNSETWTWDGTNWTRLDVATTPFGGYTVMTYDAATGSIVLFANGWTWIFDGTDWSQPSTITSSPTPRAGPAMAYDAVRGNVVLFGGYGCCTGFGGDEYLNDTWTWDGTNWTNHGSAIGGIGWRDSAALAFDPATATTVLMGGEAGLITTSYANDAWTWDGSTWTRIADGPPARGADSIAYDVASGSLILFGGQGRNGTLLGDTWMWNGNAWIGLVGSGPFITETAGGTSPDEHSTTPCTQRPVNCATGEFWHTFTDFSIPGRGIPLLFTRTYSSFAANRDGRLGYGWTDSYNMSLAIDSVSGNATVVEANGSAITFAAVNGTFRAPARVLASLVANSDGTLTMTRNSSREQFVFSSSGQLLREVDRNGYATTLTYTSGQFSSVTDAAGRGLIFSYTGSHITMITDTANRSVSFQYDGNGNLVEATDVAGGQTTFGYDPYYHLLTTLTDPNGGVTTNEYQSNASQVIQQQTDPMGYTTQFSVGQGAPTATITDPAGNVTIDQFQNNELMSQTKGAGTSSAATSTYSYDPYTQGLTALTDPNGHTSRYTWDTNGNLLTSADGLGRTTTFTYDSMNGLLTTTDPLNVTTTNTYDSHGNLTSTSTPLVGTSQVALTQLQYDPSHPGDLVQITDAAGKGWQFAYDHYGNRSRAIDPLGDVRSYSYDLVGRILSVVSAKGNVQGGNPLAYTTSYTYDPFGDVLTVTDPLSDVSTYNYDGNRNRVKLVDANNNATTYVYDKNDQLTQLQRPDGTVLTTDYNADGTVHDQRDGRNNPILTYGYNSLGQSVSATDALGYVTAYGYDGVGNLLSRQDPGGNCSGTPASGCATYHYDAANELTSVTYSDGITPNVTNVAYDADGQRTGMTDGSGASAWVWDSLHRMVTYTNGNGAQVQYAYDLRNLPTTITYPGSLTVTRGYDDASRLTSVQDWLNNTTSFVYDPNSNLTTETQPGGTGIVDTFTFDAADRLMAVSDVKGNSTLFSAAYTRDNASQLTLDSSAPSTAGAYRYTPLNQVCYAASSAANSCSSPPSGATVFNYDAADNLTQIGSTQQAFNTADQLCWTATTTGSCASAPSGATTYGYDTRGNRMQISPPSGGATTLSYDQANRVTAFGLSATYAYNGDGLRMSKTVSGTTSQLLWDVSGSLPMLIKGGSTAYIYDPAGQPLELINGSTVLWLHHDQIGSVRLVTDNTGASQATYTFDAYGNLTASSGSITNPFGFAGEYRDAESNLYYLRARYYDASTGQFVSGDPAVSSTRSPYGYVSENPQNGTDPTGMACWPPWSSSCSINLPFDLCIANGAPTCSGGLTGLSNFRENVSTANPNPVIAVVRDLSAPVALGSDIGRSIEGSCVSFWDWAAVPLDLIPGFASGTEIKLGEDLRLAPLGNRGAGRFPWPHFHRRIVDPTTGETVPGGGIGWHRPWEKGW